VGARRRDFGELTFIDLRDRDGITQVVFQFRRRARSSRKSEEARSEFVIAVTGEWCCVIKHRGIQNLQTGEVEVQAREVWILNDARTLHFSSTLP